MVGMKRWLMAAGVAALTTGAWAQITGPTPLAWKWQQPTSVAPGSLAVKGDTLFAAVGRRVYALDRATGNQRWRFPAGEQNPANFNRGAMVSGDVVVATTENRILYGLNATNGQKLWEYTIPNGLAGNPVLIGDLVVLPLSDNTLQGVRLTDGTEAWAKPIAVPNGIFGQISADDQFVYVPTQSFELFAFETIRGTARWRVQFAQLAPDVHPVISEDQIYVVSGDFVIGLARQNGGQRVRINVAEPIAFTPAVVGGTVTVVTREGKVKTFNRQGRALHPPVDLQSVAVNPPSVVAGKIVVNTSDGTMNMIEPADGSILWRYIMRPLVRPQADSNGRTPPNLMTASAPVSVVDGTLLLLGRDGQINAFDRASGVDLTPPAVRMVFPTNGFEMSGRSNVGSGERQPFFVWDIQDESTGVKLDSVKVEINGQVARHQLTRDGQLVVFIDGAQNRSLTDGPKTLTVTASDWLGNTAKTEFRILIDNTLPALRDSGGSSSGGAGGGSNRDF